MAFASPLIRSTVLLGGSYAIAAGASFLTSIAVGRALGAAELGVFTFAVSSARVLYAACDLGLQAHLTTAAAREPQRGNSLLGLFVTLRLFVAIPVALACAVCAVALGLSSFSSVLLIGFAFGIISVQGLFESVLNASRGPSAVALVTIASAVALVIGTCAWFFVQGTLVQFALTYVAATLVGVVYAGYETRSATSGFTLRWDSEVLKTELQVSYPIGIGILLGLATLKAPVLALSLFGDAHAMGVYGVAELFITASLIVHVAVTTAAFPRLAAHWNNDPAAFRRVFIASNVALLVISVLAAFAVFLLGEWVVSVLFPTRDFEQVDDIIPIIAGAIPGLLLLQHNLHVFAAAQLQRSAMRFMAVQCIVMVALQLALVPEYGVVGAAWGTLAARLIGLAVVLAACLRHGLARGKEPMP